MLSKGLPFLLIVAIASGLLLLFNYFAPLEATSVAVYAGLTIALAGLASVVKPLRFFAIRSRRTGLLVLVAGMAVTFAGLFWPAHSVRIAARHNHLDEVLPEYQFVERHEVRIHATPERVAAAMEETTFDDIRVFVALMQVRAMAYGRFRRMPSPGRRKILATFANPRSGFVPLYQDSREVVMGMAGRPWANAPALGLDGAAGFAAYDAPDAMKTAFNLLVEDEGGGWSRVVTETRARGTDGEGTRRMARYWRLIYPGSGMIRRMWLNAIRDRAERAS